MQIIENVLDTSYLEHLQYLVREDIPWNCLPNSAFSEQKKDTDSFSFAHVLYNRQDNFQSNFFPVFLPAILTILNKFGIKNYKLIRARLGLTTKIGEQIVVHTPHVDYDDPHKVIIFYINPTNGPTTIYREKRIIGNNNIPKTLSIMNQVAPVSNKALMFDGAHYHSSSKPTDSNFRFVLNINFEI